MYNENSLRITLRMLGEKRQAFASTEGIDQLYIRAIWSEPSLFANRVIANVIF